MQSFEVVCSKIDYEISVLTMITRVAEVVVIGENFDVFLQGYSCERQR